MAVSSAFAVTPFRFRISASDVSLASRCVEGCVAGPRTGSASRSGGRRTCARTDSSRGSVSAIAAGTAMRGSVGCDRCGKRGRRSATTVGTCCTAPATPRARRDAAAASASTPPRAGATAARRRRRLGHRTDGWRRVRTMIAAMRTTTRPPPSASANSHHAELPESRSLVAEPCDVVAGPGCGGVPARRAPDGGAVGFSGYARHSSSGFGCAGSARAGAAETVAVDARSTPASASAVSAYQCTRQPSRLPPEAADTRSWLPQLRFIRIPGPTGPWTRTRARRERRTALSTTVPKPRCQATSTGSIGLSCRGGATLLQPRRQRSCGV
jgi:hypothetical protein